MLQGVLIGVCRKRDRIDSRLFDLLLRREIPLDQVAGSGLSDQLLAISKRTGPMESGSRRWRFW